VARLHDPAVERRPQHDVAEVIVTSDHRAQWMLHLSTHPEVLRSLLAATSPEMVYRTMGQIEATFTEPASRAASAVQTPNVSAAPAPPPTLGSKPTQSSDEVESALKNGDFRAYREAMNRRESAQKR
jgi:uncharacterized membrane protein (UPF0182 family)